MNSLQIVQIKCINLLLKLPFGHPIWVSKVVFKKVSNWLV